MLAKLIKYRTQLLCVVAAAAGSASFFTSLSREVPSAVQRWACVGLHAGSLLLIVGYFTYDACLSRR